MKAILLLALAAFSAAVSVSGSTRDRILEMHPFEEIPVSVSATFATSPGLLSRSAERDLEDILRPRPPKAAFDPDRIKFVSEIKEDSMLYAVTDGIVSIDEAYRKIRGGIETDFWGQPMTLYAHQKLIWRLGKHEKIQLKWSGMKSVSWTRSF
jgi:hypothetical protein